MQKLLVATRNVGKLRELQQILGSLPFKLLNLQSLPPLESVEETGSTFAENACLKATGYAKQAGVLTLADDSGLMVDALDGSPGVHSARFAGDGASDIDRVQKLLSALVGVPDSQRQARFISVIAIADKHGTVINTSTGECDGQIIRSPRGEGGFGYDPVFLPSGFDKTFAELERDVKNRISHRARALDKAATFLRSLTASSPDS